MASVERGCPMMLRRLRRGSSARSLLETGPVTCARVASERPSYQLKNDSRGTAAEHPLNSAFSRALAARATRDRP